MPTPFDNVQHDRLLEKVAQRVDDADTMHLLTVMLKASGKKGVPQGGVIVPPRSTAVPGDTADTAPTQRDRHSQSVEPRGSPDIAKHGRVAWQKACGYTKRAREAAVGKFKQVVGDVLRAHGPAPGDRGDVAVHVLSRMLELERPISVRIA